MNRRRSFKAKDNHRLDISRRVDAARRDGVDSSAYTLAIASPECVDVIRDRADRFLDCIVDPLPDDVPFASMLGLAEHVEYWAAVFTETDLTRISEALRKQKWLQNKSQAELTDGVRLVDLSWWPHK